MAEKSHHRTLRNHNTNCLGHCTHIGGGNVTAAESERNIHLRSHSVEIAASGEHNSVVTHYKSTIQLCQFFDGSPQIEIGYVA